MTVGQRLAIYRMGHAMGFPVLMRTFVELRPPGFEPGDDVYIMTPSQARSFLEKWSAEEDDDGSTVH